MISTVEANYVIHLLSCAINEKQPIDPPKGISFDGLLKFSKEHQVYNIIFPLIEGSEHLTAEERQAWQMAKLVETAKMVQMNDERKQIYRELEKRGIRFMELKGLVIKNYYPRESMRQMSDNDLLYDAENCDAVYEIMKARGYKVESSTKNSDDFTKPPYCMFEFHRELFFRGNQFNPNFSYVWGNAEKDPNYNCKYNMSREDNYVYAVCHMYKHYITAGCGIRFLADTYLMVKKDGDVFDWNYINKKLTEFGIADFEKRARELALKLFDPENVFDMDTLSRDADGDSISDRQFLVAFLAHGLYNDPTLWHSYLLKQIYEKDDISVEKAKTKYFWRRVFPTKEKMVMDYKVLEKKPYLLPAYYIMRFFKMAAHPKKFVGEAETVQKIKEKDKR